MFKLIYYELKKLWNKVTILAVLLMVLISSSYYFVVYGDNIQKAVGSNGEVVEGMESYKALKEEAKDIKGIINQEYINSLVKEYNLSKEKYLYNNDPTMPLIKYKFPNLFINFINYGSEVSNFNMNLDFDFLKSEKIFYSKYKSTVKEVIKSKNEVNGIVKYTEKEIDKVNKQIDKIKTPLKVDYEEGLENFIYIYGGKYWLILIVIAFTLSTVFSKDSNNGIDELSLASTFGRKKNMNARIIAGNIFAIIAYGIFIGTLFIIIGLTASLQGWSASAQIFWNLCPYNISLGTGILMMLLMGFLGVVVVANLIMLVSINFRNYKVSTGISIGTIFLLLKLTETSNQVQLQLNPIFFSSHFTVSNLADFEIFHFLGEIMIPYSLIVIILFIVYMVIIRFLTLKSYKKYKLN